MAIEKITVRGARVHNLKNVDVEIPRNKLTVITGLSGSGKSSLAFDTIYAEGQRRYVESLSAYARQFLDQLEKPDVDSVEGLSPAISIEQKTVSKSPRSTVGTVTEIYDYLRLLFSSIGQPHCPNCGAEITRQSVENIVANVANLPEGERVIIYAPIVRGRKGEFRKELEKLAKDGFLRARIDGEMRELDEDIKLKKSFNHTIEVVVDKLLIKSGIKERLENSIRTALKLTDGAVLIVKADANADDANAEKLYSEKMACVACGINLPQLEPRSFSFNSNYGACARCNGIGSILEIDPSKIIVDGNLSSKEQTFFGIADKHGSNYLQTALFAVINKYKSKVQSPTPKVLNPKSKVKSKSATSDKRNVEINKVTLDVGLETLDFDENTAFIDLPQTVRDAFFYGAKGRFEFKEGKYIYEAEWKGAIRFLHERLNTPPTQKIKENLEELVSPVVCPECDGKRLKPEFLAVKVGGFGIAQYTALMIDDAAGEFAKIALTEREDKVAGLVLREINERLRFLKKVGLGYLTLDRGSASLSGGEGQRIRLATQIGSQLRGVLYVLDEPSIGLHPRDNQKLLETLHHLRDLGNTVLVVEHDEDTIRQADFVIDIGPGAGVHGGEIIAAGKPAEIENNENSETGKYLSGAIKIEVPKNRRKPNGKSIIVKGAKANNLKNIDVEFPLGIFNVVTGVSGSGKSTLIHDTLYNALMREVYGSLREPAAHDSIEGLDNFDKVIEIDQSPIGRTPRSNPATYTGLFTPLRELYAQIPESRARGYKAGRFSFNVKGGRCEGCEGAGVKTIEMNFLPDVYVLCDVCRGARYNRETLAVKFKNRSIADILDASIEEAFPLLENIHVVNAKLQTLMDVGLGYIKLGQSATTLSGGEAQRIKLSKELSKRATGKTIYILDEPTTGLHFADVHKLLDVLQRLVDLGNTVIVIEHNLDVIKSADHIIDLGPEGGINGGKLVATGTPEEVARNKKSHTGIALKAILSNGQARKQKVV